MIYSNFYVLLYFFRGQKLLSIFYFDQMSGNCDVSLENTLRC